ncbi:YhgE/Pip domain-containing protein [Oceanivirga miroungae]|uniref:ABC-2 type transporter transmembrane domain-containing protein n=1 Tax=Oceanivirga miroungae TaxID=1130046 RepID=A0A6I8MEF5_9FUSO|nr:YhgE/Pip domain-containing protein [Oceanivirga miroungae]VWL85869.1 hypothetical protein OMES3154_01154 [Oceanivirga miroungae]
MKINKKYIKPIVITAVIMIIPFFYVLFFLKAFWDPYSNMKNIPVALVNLDKGEVGKDIVDKIVDSNIMDIKFLDSIEEANKGVKDRKYYASISIPENFTYDLEHLNKTEIVYHSNKKYNFIASQIYEKVAIEIQHSIKEKVGAKVVKKLNEGIEDSANKVSKLNVGLGKINDGSSKIHEGIKTLSGKYEEFDKGVNSLDNGLKTLDTGYDKYRNGVDKAVDGLDKISEGVVSLGDRFPLLKISSNFKKLYNGAKKVKTDNVKNQINEGGIKLKEGIDKLNSGSEKLSSSSALIKNALTQFKDYSKKLDNGIREAHLAVNHSSKEANKKLKELKNLNDFVENSVSLKIVDIDNVDNYGTVFAAYFMSISLWVGSLVIIVVMYYDAKDRFGIFDRNYKNKIKQYGLYLGLVLIQSFILSALVTVNFNFSNLSFPILLASMIISDLAFFSMVYFFIISFDDIGKFLTIILLIIQISASAGTFPIETAPKLFIDIFPFIPMKYSVSLFKEAFAGFDAQFFIPNFATLSELFILFSILIFVVAKLKNKNKV